MRTPRIFLAAASGATAMLVGILGSPSPLAATASVTVVVSPSLGRHAISPLIYGLNATATEPGFAALQATARPTLLRLGGNRWSAYNWENNDSNAGSDWYYENDDFLSSSTSPADAVLSTLRPDAAAGRSTLLTLPITDSVAADRLGTNVEDTPNWLSTRFLPNLLQTPGVQPANLPMRPSLTDGKVYQDQFLEYLRRQVPRASVLVDLDNEPDLWSSTHAEIHPVAVTYGELLRRDLAAAAMVKAVWPGATVAGPVNYGWEGMATLQQASDAPPAPGGEVWSFLPWWLQHLHGAEAAAHHRLVDLLDVHWYPEAEGGGVRITGTDTTAAVVAAREQAPRSLYDPSYVEQSWITQWSTAGRGIDLLDRLATEVRTHNPGMGLSISEWDYGAGGSISGAIADADVLGAFGTHGVTAAAYWPLSDHEAFSTAAFALFRNFDGHGGAFGSTSIRATSSSIPTVTAYASLTSGAHPSTVVVLINKATAPSATTLTVSGATRQHHPLRYQLTAATPRVLPAGSVAEHGAGKLALVLPAQSITVLAGV